MRTSHVVIICLTAFAIATEKFLFDAGREAVRDQRIIEQLMTPPRNYPPSPNDQKPSVEIRPSDEPWKL